MADPTFEECWNEFRRRTAPRYAAFVELLKQEYPAFCDGVTSMLDIGAGDGEFDELMIKEMLPALTCFNAIESDSALCDTLQHKIKSIKNRNIQVNVNEGFMQLYDGPSEPVDLIIMCAVAYYIPDKQAMVKQALDWLKPGGRFIMIHWPQNTPMVKAQDPIRVSSDVIIESSFDGAALLTEMHLQFTEHRLAVPFEVTKEGLDKVLRILLHRTPKESEVDQFSVSMAPYMTTKDSKDYVDMPYSILVIPKP